VPSPQQIPKSALESIFGITTEDTASAEVVVPEEVETQTGEIDTVEIAVVPEETGEIDTEEVIRVSGFDEFLKELAETVPDSEIPDELLYQEIEDLVAPPEPYESFAESYGNIRAEIQAKLESDPEFSAQATQQLGTADPDDIATYSMGGAGFAAPGFRESLGLEPPDMRPSFADAGLAQSVTGNIARIAHKIVTGKPSKDIDLARWEPNALEQIASTVTSFLMPADIALFRGGGKVGEAVIKPWADKAIAKLVMNGVGKEQAEVLVNKGITGTLGRMSQSAGGLGVYDAVSSVTDQWASTGNFFDVDWGTVGKEAAHGAILGAATSLFGELAGRGGFTHGAKLGVKMQEKGIPIPSEWIAKGAQFESYVFSTAAQIGTFTLAEPTLAGENFFSLPAEEQKNYLYQAAGVILGMQIAHGVQKSTISDVAHKLRSEMDRGHSFENAQLMVSNTLKRRMHNLAQTSMGLRSGAIEPYTGRVFLLPERASAAPGRHRKGKQVKTIEIDGKVAWEIDSIGKNKIFQLSDGSLIRRVTYRGNSFDQPLDKSEYDRMVVRSEGGAKAMRTRLQNKIWINSNYLDLMPATRVLQSVTVGRDYEMPDVIIGPNPIASKPLLDVSTKGVSYDVIPANELPAELQVHPYVKGGEVDFDAIFNKAEQEIFERDNINRDPRSVELELKEREIEELQSQLEQKHIELESERIESREETKERDVESGKDEFFSAVEEASEESAKQAEEAAADKKFFDMLLEPRAEKAPEEKVEAKPTEESIADRFNEDQVNNTGKIVADKLDINTVKDKRQKGGTTRDVYNIDGKVIKVAKNPRGIEQNESIGHGDERILGSFLPRLYEKGKDYIVVEDVPRNDKEVRKFLKPLQKFSAKDFEDRGAKLQEVLDELGLTDFMNYDILWNDFIAARNWGQRKNGEFVLVDEGALNNKVTSTSEIPDWAKAEWEEIKSERRAKKKEGEDLIPELEEETHIEYAMDKITGELEGRKFQTEDGHTIEVVNETKQTFDYKYEDDISRKIHRGSKGVKGVALILKTKRQGVEKSRGVINWRDASIATPTKPKEVPDISVAPVGELAGASASHRVSNKLTRELAELRETFMKTDKEIQDAESGALELTGARLDLLKQSRRQTAEIIGELERKISDYKSDGKGTTTVGFEVIPGMRTIFTWLGKRMEARKEEPSLAKMTDFEIAVMYQLVTGKTTGSPIAYEEALRLMGEVGLAQSPLIRMGGFTRTAHEIHKIFNPLAGLPKETQRKYLKSRDKLSGKLYRTVQSTEALVKELVNTSIEDKRTVYKYLNGEIKSISEVPEELRPFTRNVRRHFDSVGAALVKRGILSAKSYKEMKGKYITRVYLRFLEEFGPRISKSAKMSTWYGKQRKDLSEKEKTKLGLLERPDVSIRVGLLAEWGDVFKYDFLKEVLHTEGLVYKPSIVTVEGEPMGIGSAVHMLNVYKNMLVHASSAEAPAIRMHAKELEVVLQQAREEMGVTPKDFVQIPDTKGYGVLRGAFVSKPVAEDIIATFKITDAKGINELEKAASKMYKRTLSFYKGMKVAANPPTIARNMGSNIIQMYMSGIPMTKIAPLLRQTAMKMYQNSPEFVLAKRSGVISGTWAEAEIAQILEHTNTLQSEMAGGTGTVDKLFNFMGKGARFYGKIDEFYKFAKFLEGRNKGLSPEDATIEAQKWVMDYSLVSPAVRAMRENWFGMPFITYQTKIAPLMIEAARERPHVYATLFGLPAAASAVALASMDIEKEEWDTLKLSIGDHIMQGSFVVLPFKDDKGRVQVYPIDYMYPFDFWAEIGLNLLEGDVGDAGSRLFGQNPAFAISVALQTGKLPTPSGEYIDIYSPLDDGQLKAEKFFGFLYNLMTPGFLAKGGAVDKTAEALGVAKKEGIYGTDLTVLQAASRFAGLNITPADKMTLVRRNNSLRYKMRKLDAGLNRELKNAASREASEDELNDIAERYADKMAEAMFDFTRKEEEKEEFGEEVGRHVREFARSPQEKVLEGVTGLYGKLKEFNVQRQQ